MLVKLMKYELIRRRNSMLMILASILLIEAFILYQIYNSNEEVAFFLNIVMFIAMNIAMVYENVKLLSDDLNNQSGYMLFLTPNSGYKITAAKMLTGFTEVIIGYVVVVAIMYYNGVLLYEVANSEIISSLLWAFGEGLNLVSQIGITPFEWFQGIFSNFANWFSFVVLIYLAIILRKTLFSNIRFKGLISFGVFILLSTGINMLTQGVMTAFVNGVGFFDTSSTFGNELKIDQMIILKNLIVQLTIVSNLISLTVIAVAFYASGYLLNKKVDL